MRIPLLGGHSKRGSVNQDSQTLVNMFLEFDAAEKEANIAAYLVPGKVEWATVGSGPIHGLARLSNAQGRFVIAVSGQDVYAIREDGTSALVGTILFPTPESVVMVSNQNVCVICSGSGGWYTNGVTLEPITDDAFYGASSITFLDNFICLVKPDSQMFYISNLYDATSYDGLDVAMAESNVDKLVAVVADHQELWLFGEHSTEVWYNSGAADFPFARREGAVLEVGCAAPQSAAKADNSIFWLGQSPQGKGVVYRADQYSPFIISNRGVEYAISQLTRTDDARAYAYQQSGHTFYVLTFPTDGVTFVYDASVKDTEMAWSVRSTYGKGRDRGNAYVFSDGEHLLGDFESGVIWALDHDTYTDGGLPIAWERTTTHIIKDMKRIFFNDIRINMERGVGLEDGTDPLMYLDWSDDGGHTWSNKKQASMGVIGKYLPMVTFSRLGSSRDRVFRLSGSAPVKTVLIGAYLDAKVGNYV
jgi:hypothetical protein